MLVMFSYPLQIHPCRASVDAVMRWRPSSNPLRPHSPSRSSPSGALPLVRSSAKPTGSSRPTEVMSETRFAAITTAIIILSYAVAMTVSSLEKVLAYVGSTGSTSISFILPGLFYYKISDPEGNEHQKLMKEDDDESDEDDDAAVGEEMTASGLLGEGMMRGSGLLDRMVGGLDGRKKLLRSLSLALAVYGVVVMVVCLVTNTFFVTAH